MISAIGNQTINEDASTAAVPFILSDPDTPIASLQITASSSNSTLAPVSSIVLAGTGANRTIRITPAADQYGTALISVNATDGEQLTQRQFTLTSNPINDPPSFSNLGNQLFAASTASGIKTVSGWANNLVMGPANESDQTPDQFLIQRMDNNVPNIIGGTAPAVSLAPIGQLTFSLANDGEGQALNGYSCFLVFLTDSGAANPPNSNVSAATSLKIQVGPGNFSCPVARGSTPSQL